MTTIPFHIYANSSAVMVSDIIVSSCTMRDFIKVQAASSLSAMNLSFTSINHQPIVDLTKALINLNMIETLALDGIKITSSMLLSSPAFLIADSPKP
jgi:hypothetical protein